MIRILRVTLKDRNAREGLQTKVGCNMCLLERVAREGWGGLGTWSGKTRVTVCLPVCVFCDMTVRD